MSNSEIGAFVVVLFALLAVAHVVGYAFTRLRQPRVIGEIVGGLLLGPTVLGHFAPGISARLFAVVSATGGKNPHDDVLSFVYWLGMLLLMFASGAETKNLFARRDQREIGWLASVGTGLPFVIVMAASPWLPLESMAGTVHQHTALLLVIGIAVAVTSIPVISRIFFDLKILHTRFARLILGVAVIEDTVLWAALAIATALAASATLPRGTIVRHVLTTIAYFGVGLTIAPALLRRLSRVRWNLLASSSPLGYTVLVLFAYCMAAAWLDVNLVFAAFLAGFAVPTEGRFSAAFESLKNFSFAFFIPVYFAVVGFKLDLARDFSLTMLAVFLVGGCALKVACVAGGAWLAGFRRLDVVNLAVATNARGGPGIVLASVAYESGIVNAAGYTTLVLLAVLTSQAAGAWLEYVLRRGWPLLSGEAEEAAPAEVVTIPERLAS